VVEEEGAGFVGEEVEREGGVPGDKALVVASFDGGFDGVEIEGAVVRREGGPFAAYAQVGRCIAHDQDVSGVSMRRNSCATLFRLLVPLSDLMNTTLAS